MMDAAPVRWWTRDAGFAGGLAPEAVVPDGVVIGVDGQDERYAAREAIRAALRAALAQSCGVGHDAVKLHAAPGQAPWAIVDRDGVAHRAWVAITHDGALSLAAFRFTGAVGIDVMRIASVPDWAPVARDYLGPAVASALSTTPATLRDAAFARAWSEREARLKCLGWGVREWQAADEPALQACACHPLAVPDGYVATLALALA
jgi:4'-phosphopantetheinyl transferase